MFGILIYMRLLKQILVCPLYMSLENFKVWTDLMSVWKLILTNMLLVTEFGSSAYQVYLAW